MKIDNSDFNENHFANFSEAEFIKHELASVPDKYGSENNKIDFLKNAYAVIKWKQPQAQDDNDQDDNDQ